MAANNTSWAALLDQFQRGTDPLSAFRVRCDAISNRMIDLLGGQGGVTIPEAPEGLVVTSPAVGQITSTWDPVPTAYSYFIYVGPANGGTLLSGISNSTDFTLTNQPAGEYRVEISATNSAGEGPRSASVSVTVEEETTIPDPPDSITGFTVPDLPEIQNGVAMSWDAFTGTTVTARLERLGPGNFTYETIATGVTGTSYVDVQGLQVGGIYSYRIIGRNSVGFETAASPPVTITVGSTPDTEAPPVPLMLAADAQGSATQAPIMTCVCSSVFATDLAGYQFGISLADDPNTAEWSGTYTSPVGFITEHAGGDLLGGSTYYVWARSVDSQVPPNISAPSPASNSEFVVLTISVTAPSKPRNLLTASEVPGDITLAWTINSSTGPLTGFEVYRSSLVSGEVIVAQPGPEDRSVTLSGMDPEVPYTFRMRAVQLGSFSNYSDSVSDTADGFDATGGGIGEGGGPYDGDTAFGVDYVIPGVTLDYVVDMRDYVGTTNAVAEAIAIFKTRTEYAVGNPLHVALSTTSEAKKHLAVLLPDRVETRMLTMSRSGITGTDGADTQWLLDSNTDLHFVGSAVSALGTAVLDSENVRDNGDSLSFGYVYAPDASAVQNAMVLDLVMERADSGIHLHNWSIEPVLDSLGSTVRVGRNISQVGTNTGLVSGLNALYMHNSRMITSAGSEAPGTTGIESYLSHVHMDGVYWDLPHAREFGMILDAVPNGDMTWERVSFYRLGASFAALLDTTAFNYVAGLERPTLGTLTIRDWKCPDAWSSRWLPAQGPIFRQMGLHQEIVIQDCDFVSTRTIGASRQSWSNFDFFAENIGDTGFTASVTLLATVVNGTVAYPVQPTSNGTISQGVTLNSVRFFSEDPRVSILDLKHAEEITITDSVLLTNDDSTIDIASGGSGSVPYLFQSFNMSDNNVAGDVTAFETAYGLTATQVPDVVAGNNDVNLGSSTEDQTWVNFVGPAWNPPTDPPDAITPINAIAMYDAGLTMPQAKLVKVPAMIATREPRADGVGALTVRRWRYMGPGTGYSATADWQIIFGNNLNGPTSDPHVSFSPDWCVMTVADVDLRFPDSQKSFHGHYETNKYNSNTWAQSTNNQNPAIPGGTESVFPKEAGDKWGAPSDVKEILNNCFFGDHGDRRRYARPEYSGNAGLNSDVKWAIRHNGLNDVLFQSCDWQYVHQEHACYFNSMGDAEWRDCTWRDIGSQGLQLVNRSDDWGKKLHDPLDPENPEYTNDGIIGVNRKLTNCHFLDVGNWSNQSQNKSSVINFYSSGYPDNPAELVKMEDCSIITGLTYPESAAERIAAGDPSSAPYFNRSDNGGDKQSSTLVAVILEDQGGQANQQLDPTHGEAGAGSSISTKMFRTTYTDAAAARADNAATMVKVAYFKNCYFHQQDAANPMFRFDSIHTIIFEDCVFIHDEIYGTTQRAFSIDSGISAYASPDSWNYMPGGDLHGTHHLIFRNCRAEMRDVLENRVVTSVDAMSMKWHAPTTDDINFIGFGSSENQELHFKGYQDGRTEPILDYQGPIDPGRPGYIAPPA